MASHSASVKNSLMLAVIVVVIGWCPLVDVFSIGWG